MTYSGTLRPDPPTGATDPDLYAFSFTTSAFATFAHHVHSFSGRLWDIDQTLEGTLAALTSAQQAALRAAAASGKPEDFEVLAALLKLPTQPLPEALELTLLHDAAQRLGFLVESPEPLDAARVSAQLRSSATIVGEARHAGSVRVRDAAFGDRSGGDYNAEWVELLLVESCEITGLLHLKQASDPSTFQTLDTITASGWFEPGDIVRVHARIAPSTAPDDGRRHLYLTPSGGTPTWMLHPGQDTLRLVDSGGGELSRQEVCGGFGAFGATWLWNRDRTRAFVLPARAPWIRSKGGLRKRPGCPDECAPWARRSGRPRSSDEAGVTRSPQDVVTLARAAGTPDGAPAADPQAETWL